MPKRVDNNQKKIVEKFRQLGASVQILSMIGKGCPDILVGLNGKNYLFEIKNPDQPISQQVLTEHEIRFFANWNGHVEIIKTEEEVTNFVKSCYG